jgi:DNA-binding FadR family transcriptional regulator
MLFCRGGSLLHKAIYLATHNEFFWPIGQLFSVALKEMFRLAALGSHRPRAIVEHGDVLRAVLEREPEMARTAALTLLGNAASDIKLIRETALDRI